MLWHNPSSIQSGWIYLKVFRSQLEGVLCLFSGFLMMTYYFTVLFSLPSLFSNFPFLFSVPNGLYFEGFKV